MTELGVPQERQRVIVLGIRDDIVSDTEQVTSIFDRLCRENDEPVNIQSGLSGLPRLLRGEGGTVVAGTGSGNRCDFITDHDLNAGTKLSFNHQARQHPMTKDQKLFEEALEPGETGWDVKYRKDGKYADLIEYDVGTEDEPRFKDKYRMLEWDKPSPTIVAHLAKDSNSFVLPDYYEHVRVDESLANKKRNRGITPREAARLQTFPDQYIFLGPFTSWFRQIGNAVPPLAGKRIGNILATILNEEYIDQELLETQPATQVLSDD